MKVKHQLPLQRTQQRRSEHPYKISHQWPQWALLPYKFGARAEPEKLGNRNTFENNWKNTPTHFWRRSGCFQNSDMSNMRKLLLRFTFRSACQLLLRFTSRNACPPLFYSAFRNTSQSLLCFTFTYDHMKANTYIISYFNLSRCAYIYIYIYIYICICQSIRCSILSYNIKVYYTMQNKTMNHDITSNHEIIINHAHNLT